MFDRIVVGLDGSQVSETALKTGAELARRMGVPLHLVQVADLSVVPLGANQAAAAYAELSKEMVQEKGKAARYLESVAQPLHDEGLAVTTEVRSGFAAQELAGAAGPGDLLIVASRGRHGLERLVLGSVAEEVVKKSPAPVLVARGG
ncbi:MAG: universal stress protein [Chloroflexi bacterium]|nr:universal stress protein [Chloroflexota bacterium]